jgi:hypothetical protein
MLVASGWRMDSVELIFKKAKNQSILAYFLSVQVFGTFKFSFREKSKANFLIPIGDSPKYMSAEFLI